VTNRSAAAPSPSTPTGSSAGGLERNASPNTTAMITGKANTQKSASGCRQNSSSRARVISQSGCGRGSLISPFPQPAAGELDEDVLERRLVSGESGDRPLLALEQLQQRRQRRAHVGDRQHQRALARRQAAHAGQRADAILDVTERRRGVAGQRELEDLLGAERGDELR